MTYPRTHLTRLVEWHQRYGPLLDTTLTLAALVVPVVGGLAGWGLWLLFSDHLAWLGQGAVPAAQFGDWLALALFGVAVTALLAGLVLAPAA